MCVCVCVCVCACVCVRVCVCECGGGGWGSVCGGVGGILLQTLENVFFFFHGTFSPQKPYGLLGTQGKNGTENESPGPPSR